MTKAGLSELERLKIKLGSRLYSKEDMDENKKDHFIAGDWCEWCKENTGEAHYHYKGKKYKYK